MRIYRIIFLMLLAATVVSSCSTSIQKHEDPFYNDAGTHDSLKLPLLNPYYLVYINEEYGWQMAVKGNFPDDQYYYNVGDLLDITKVTVENGIIMVYTPHNPNIDESVGQKSLHWFVMIPDSGNFEIGFGSELEFLNYIQKFDINQPQWAEPSSTYQEFYKTGCFDWVPDCK